MINKVISGGQTGADIAGLECARCWGIATGGFMPKDFRTLDGSKPEYEKLYGMRCTGAATYPPRTFTNVRASDGTIRFYTKPDSPGERLTRNACIEYGKPFIDVDFLSINPMYVGDVIRWINQNNIFILNVAGNSEQTSPGIYDRTFLYLNILFDKLAITK